MFLSMNGLMVRWRNIIDKCLPRTDLMEIAWHEVPMVWQEEMSRLAVSPFFSAFD